MVESHDETPSSTENSSKPEEPLPHPSSTEAPIESKSSNAKTIQWEQDLKNSGYILCDCRTGFLDLNGKNLSSLRPNIRQIWPKIGIFRLY